MAFGGSDAGVLIAGSVLTSLGLGVFSAVTMAFVLDVFPEQDVEAGRFIGNNYGLLFLIAAVCTLVGCIFVTWKVRGTN